MHIAIITHEISIIVHVLITRTEIEIFIWRNPFMIYCPQHVVVIAGDWAAANNVNPYNIGPLATVEYLSKSVLTTLSAPDLLYTFMAATITHKH